MHFVLLYHSVYGFYCGFVLVSLHFYVTVFLLLHFVCITVLQELKYISLFQRTLYSVYYMILYILHKSPGSVYFSVCMRDIILFSALD